MGASCYLTCEFLGLAASVIFSISHACFGRKKKWGKERRERRILLYEKEIGGSQCK